MLGIAIGYFFPDLGKSLKPLGDAFIKLVKMMIAPIIFCTVVHGIASVGDLRTLGAVGIKSLVYFEVVSTLALIIGLVVVICSSQAPASRPLGKRFHADAAAVQSSASYVEKAHTSHGVDFFLNIIPSTFLGAFVSGELLQVLFVSILVALAIAFMDQRRQPILDGIEQMGHLFFGVMQIVVRARLWVLWVRWPIRWERMALKPSTSCSF